MDYIVLAEQMRRTMQMFAGTLTDEQAMEVATIYDSWKIGKSYAQGEIFSYGVNSVGDPQLYRVNQAHTSQADWLPDAEEALYTPIGLDESGYPVWAQPTGAHDAYNAGDVVNYNGTMYRSLINGNCTVPGTDGRYWEAV